MASVLHTVALASWLWIAKKKLELKENGIDSYMCHSVSIQMHIAGNCSCRPKIQVKHP